MFSISGRKIDLQRVNSEVASLLLNNFMDYCMIKLTPNCHKFEVTSYVDQSFLSMKNPTFPFNNNECNEYICKGTHI